MRRLLITGAAGGLGSMCRERLAPMAETLRLSDVAGLGEAAPNEEIVRCDLGDADAVRDLVRDCDGIVHLGGISVERSWSLIRNANIDGLVNLYEGVRRTMGERPPRIVFASSNHAIGFHPQSERLDASSTTRPDGLYGVSKVFGEAVASLYHDKFGIETARVRIGSCRPEPDDHRMLATWMSADDFVSLIECVFRAPRLGCPVVYGASDNDVSWWDNREVGYLGWQPKDNAEVFRAALDAAMDPPPPDAPTALYQGGAFAAEPIHDDEQ